MLARFGIASFVAVCGLWTAENRLSAQSDSRPQVMLSGQVVGADGKPLAGATVQPIGWQGNGAAVKSDGEGRFSFAADLGTGGWIYSALLAQAADGRLGFEEVRLAKPAPVRVEVKLARELKVLVEDQGGKPVAGAEVQFLGVTRLLVTGQTDAQGTITCRVPADVGDWAVLAKKPQLGFDYRTSQHARGSTDEPYPLPTEIKLQLDGARTARVLTVDQSGKPVAGVKVGLWYLQKPGYEADINLSGTVAAWPTTNAEGIVVLDWLPEKFERNLPVICHSEDYYAPEFVFWNRAEKPVSEVTLTMSPLETLSGRVTHADGRPAEGMMVMVEGQGVSRNGFTGAARTDRDGRYRLKVYGEHVYVVRAGDDSFASPCRGDVVVRTGQMAEGVDLVLSRATLVRGRVTVGSDNKPAAERHLSATLEPRPAAAGAAPQFGSRPTANPRMRFGAKTDADGKYELRLGPGEYQLSGPSRTQAVKLTIPASGGPEVLVHNFHMPRAESGPLVGRVVDRDGKPVPGAAVEGHYTSSIERSLSGLKTNQAGEFRINRSLDPLVIHAQSADSRLAGVARSEAAETETTVVVGPVTRATGQLKDPQGQPIGQRQMRYGVLIVQGEPGPKSFIDAFGGTATTDADGNFTLAGLVPGQSYSLSVKIDDSRSRAVTEVMAPDAQPLALGELTVDPNPSKPYVPPTPAERTATAFTAKRDTPIAERLENLLAEAKREYVRPMLLFGQATDPACVELFRLFEHQEADGDKAAKPDYKTLTELRWEFELAALDVSRPELRDFAAKLKIDLAGGKPVLAMLNVDGSLAETLALELKDKKLDPRPIGGWFARFKLPTRDAQKMLDDALAKAQAEDKKVFFILSASWCGPCRMLARFLAPHKSELEKHFVFVKLDISRDEHAEELQERFKESAQGGVPWFCILDQQAKVLTTSNLPKINPQYGTSNMGFPTLPAEVEHFVGMLRKTAPRLPEERLAEYKAELLKKK